MFTHILLIFCCQFGPVFNEVTGSNSNDSTVPPLSVEFLAQSPNGTDGKIHIKVYSGKSCKWCKQQYDLVGEGDERIAIDWTEEDLPKTVQERLHRGYQFPVFVCEQEDGTLVYPSKWAIYSCDQLVSMFGDTKPLKVNTYTASGVGGVLRGRQHIKRMFKWLDDNVGQNVKISISWDRTGAQTFPFKSGTDWSANALLGRMGYFDLKIQGSQNILFSELATGYKYIDNTEDLELTPKIVIKNFGANRFNASNDVPRKLDPVVITTIISVVQILYQVLNPKVDLQLPGNLNMEWTYNGKDLEILFNRSPSIRVSAWFEFNLTVKKILVNTDKIHLDFSGSKWIKSRVIKVVE